MAGKNLRDTRTLKQLHRVIVARTREVTIGFGLHSDVRAVVVGDFFLLVGWEHCVVSAGSRHIQVTLLELILHPVSKLGLLTMLLITLLKVKVADQFVLVRRRCLLNVVVLSLGGAESCCFFWNRVPVLLWS